MDLATLVRISSALMDVRAVQTLLAGTAGPLEDPARQLVARAAKSTIDACLDVAEQASPSKERMQGALRFARQQDPEFLSRVLDVKRRLGDQG